MLKSQPILTLGLILSAFGGHSSLATDRLALKARGIEVSPHEAATVWKDQAVVRKLQEVLPAHPQLNPIKFKEVYQEAPSEATTSDLLKRYRAKEILENRKMTQKPTDLQQEASLYLATLELSVPAEMNHQLKEPPTHLAHTQEDRGSIRLGNKNSDGDRLNAAAYSIGTLGRINAAYLTPNKDQLKALIHLQTVADKDQPTEAEVRATILLQTPDPTVVGRLAGTGAILDPDPSADRIEATVFLQDWVRPAVPIGQVVPRPTLAQIDAVAKCGESLVCKRAVAWAIQEGFASRGVGTIPVCVGELIEVIDGFHYFKLVHISKRLPPPPKKFGALPSLLEPVRELLFNHVDGSFKTSGVTGFKVSNAQIAGLFRLNTQGELAEGECIVNMGLTPDLNTNGGVLMVDAANCPN